MGKKIAYLGPPGTFCEQAAKMVFPQVDHEWLPGKTIEEVFELLHKDKAEAAVLPMENSCEGSVNQTIDLLAYGYSCGVERQESVKIVGEITLPVRHSLIAPKGIKREQIEAILSHPQALAQCRAYLQKNYPGAQLKEVSSTAEAVRQSAQSGKPWAAIAMIDSARNYDLTVIDRDINDYPGNETRFILLAKEEGSCSLNCKTTILLMVKNQPGALYQVLKAFSLRGINLTKIESRPAKTQIGEYLFVMDVDGHYKEPHIIDAFAEIRQQTQALTILGSYPASNAKGQRVSVFETTLDALRREVDLLDEQIVELFGRRTRLVEKIGAFKASAGEVHDPKREEYILDKLSKVAEDKGFSPEVTRSVYQKLFEHFVSLQQKQK